MKIHFDFDHNPVLFFILLISIWLLTLYYYRVTIPPIRPLVRKICILLRGMALSLVLCLLFGPVMQITSRRQEKPCIALMIDDSESMNLSEDSGHRSDPVFQFLESPVFDKIRKNTNIEMYVFSDECRCVTGPDVLRFRGRATDITSALDQVFNEVRPGKLRAVFMISDGGHNTGLQPENRTRHWNVPIHTIGLGSDTEKADFILTEVIASKIAYVGLKTPVRVSFRSPGFEKKHTSLVMRAGQKELFRKPIITPENGLEMTVELDWIPSKAGHQKLTILADSLSGELTKRNNQREISISVRKQKQSILILSGAPSADQSCLRQLFARDENLELIVRTQSPDRQFYEGPLEFSSRETFDMVILLDMPNRATSPDFWDDFKRACQSSEWPVLVMAGSSIEEAGLRRFSAELPVQSFGPRTFQSIYPFLSETGIQHPICLAEDETISQSAWSQLPPVQTAWPDAKIMPDAQVIVSGRTEIGRDTSMPLIITRSFQGKKSMVILAHNLYRWHMLSWQENNPRDLFFRFLIASVNWLTDDDQNKPVRFVIEDRIYQTGSPLEIRAEVYDEALQPVEDAIVRFTAVRQGMDEQTLLKPEGRGLYKTQLIPVDSGDYRLVIEAERKGRLLGRDTTVVSVSAFHPEYLDIRAHPEILKFISRETGGIFVHSDSIESLLPVVPSVPEILDTERQIRPVQNVLILLFTVALLTTEWWIRRRKGMI